MKLNINLISLHASTESGVRVTASAQDFQAMEEFVHAITTHQSAQSAQDAPQEPEVAPTPQEPLQSAQDAAFSRIMAALGDNRYEYRTAGALIKAHGGSVSVDDVRRLLNQRGVNFVERRQLSTGEALFALTDE